MLMPSVSNAVVNLIIVGALLERWPQLKAHLSAGVALTAIASASLAILLPILRASRLVLAQQLEKSSKNFASGSVGAA
jgi:peptidoglycan biosynthesis protein MviN/MurJ (putative lipid II flippase)